MFTRLICLALCISFAADAWGQMITAHRGASYDAPENTLAAFKEAWAQGADAIEADFYFTADQKIVCIHDKDTLRTGGRKLDVAGSTLEQMRALEYGGWKDPRFAGEPLPTFEEVLAIVPRGKHFVVELKTGPAIVPLLKAELERLPHEADKLLIIAFNADTVRECKRLLPHVRVHWLTGYEQDKATGVWHPTAAEVARTLESSGADGLGTKGDRRVVTPEFLAELRRGGMKEFHVWTIDSIPDAVYFQEQGTVGVTTNRPGYIKAALTTEKKRAASDE